MQRRAVVSALVLMWVIGMGWSAWSLFGMAPNGDGLARGFNKIFGFMVGQAIGGITAVLALILGWKLQSARDKWLSRGPALLSLLIALGIGGLILRAKHAPSEPPIQTLPTKPASPVAVD